MAVGNSLRARVRKGEPVMIGSFTVKKLDQRISNPAIKAGGRSPQAAGEGEGGGGPSESQGKAARWARGPVTARLDLLAHEPSEATRAARFPDDEALEASAVGALEALNGRLCRYSHVLTAPTRAPRDGSGAGFRRQGRSGAEGLRL
jgi:hypothetical protein